MWNGIRRIRNLVIPIPRTARRCRTLRARGNHDEIRLQRRQQTAGSGIIGARVKRLAVFGIIITYELRSHRPTVFHIYVHTHTRTITGTRDLNRCRYTLSHVSGARARVISYTRHETSIFIYALWSGRVKTAFQSRRPIAEMSPPRHSKRPRSPASSVLCRASFVISIIIIIYDYYNNIIVRSRSILHPYTPPPAHRSNIHKTGRN